MTDSWSKKVDGKLQLKKGRTYAQLSQVSYAANFYFPNFIDYSMNAVGFWRYYLLLLIYQKKKQFFKKELNVNLKEMISISINFIWNRFYFNDMQFRQSKYYDYKPSWFQTGLKLSRCDMI